MPVTLNSTLMLAAVALAAWTFVMWAWMYATRIPAVRRARMKLDPMAPRGEQMGQLPPQVRWKADNYNHLYEQPTLFYPIVIIAALLPTSGTPEVALAWTYVGMRVVHSIFQSTVNRIEVRFALFILSSLVLLALVVRTGMGLV
jgi:hypothetical protein